MKQFFDDQQTLAKENICDLDKDFVEKFKALIDAKMGESTLNVEDLAKEMGLSRFPARLFGLDDSRDRLRGRFHLALLLHQVL